MRLLKVIAEEIAADWTVINNTAARDALSSMATMRDAKSPYGADPNGYSVVAVFLGNSVGWRGPVARRIKQELREISGHPPP